MKKHISILALLIALGVTSCNKDYLSLENNPNQPSITTPQLALSSAEVSAAAIVQTNYPEYAVWSGYWTTSGNYTPNQAINEYQLTTTTYTPVWDNLYLNISNFNTLKLLAAKDGGLGNFQAIAQIMIAYDFEQLVDNFNDVPYSQAFDTKQTSPAYDKGQDIYHDLGKQLDAAIALINKTANNSLAVSPGVSDVIFGGNMTGWKKFANSIKLRLAIRVHTKTPADVLISDLASTASEGYLDGAIEAAANPGYSSGNSGSGISQESPFYGDYGYDVTGNPTGDNVYYRANSYAISFYTTNSDLRIGAFYSPAAANSKYQGNIFGATITALQNPLTSAIGPGLLKSSTQNAVLFSGAESLFLQAEAIQDGLTITGNVNTPTSAQTAYESAITASFVLIGLTTTQAATYYGQNKVNVNWVSSSDKDQAILTQKWAALNGYFNLEAYNEYRRTGIPTLPSSVDPAAISPTLPTRILYPISELNTNSLNLAKEGVINQFTSKIFWAK